MRDAQHWLNRWVYEGKRVLPLLTAWRDALVRRDLVAIEAMHARLQPALQQLEHLKATMPAPLKPDPSDLSDSSNLSDLPHLSNLSEALAVARAIDEVIQSAYDIILNELDYTHALMAMLVRAAEPEHYAPLSRDRAASTVMLNTEV
jgi:hypothetical protein